MTKKWFEDIILLYRKYMIILHQIPGRGWKNNSAFRLLEGSYTETILKMDINYLLGMYSNKCTHILHRYYTQYFNK
jgi:hypothetical protein